MLQVGSKLKAKWTEDLVDHVTKDNVYTFVEVDEVGFRIINDKGNKCFPISTTFTRIS